MILYWIIQSRTWIRVQENLFHSDLLHESAPLHSVFFNFSHVIVIDNLLLPERFDEEFVMNESGTHLLRRDDICLKSSGRTREAAPLSGRLPDCGERSAGQKIFIVQARWTELRDPRRLYWSETEVSSAPRSSSSGLFQISECFPCSRWAERTRTPQTNELITANTWWPYHVHVDSLCSWGRSDHTNRVSGSFHTWYPPASIT